jgi:hypothetical protein
LLAADGSATAVTGSIVVTADHPGTLVSLSPSRILDTRTGNGAAKRAVASHGTLSLKVTGRGGVPASGVSAVVLNVTVTGTAANGYITVYPNGSARPLASSLNFAKGHTVANLVIARVGTSGEVKLFNGALGSVQLVADVTGYFRAGTAVDPGALTSLAPSRILDTRTGNGAAKHALASHGTLSLKVTGRGGVPASGVSAVVLNVTVTGTAANGYITVYPNGSARPLASSLNFVKGQTVPNLVIARVGSSGEVKLFNGALGSVHLVADVTGYFLDGTPTVSGAYRSLNPSRILDTRTGNGAPKHALAARGTLSLTVAGRGGVPATGAAAVAMNVTVTAPAANGYITVYPSGSTLPLASNLNFQKGQTVPNLAIDPLGSGGAVRMFNGAHGSVQLVTDVTGYFLK